MSKTSAANSIHVTFGIDNCPLGLVGSALGGIAWLLLLQLFNVVLFKGTSIGLPAASIACDFLRGGKGSANARLGPSLAPARECKHRRSNDMV
jgi:hypothetical protein